MYWIIIACILPDLPWIGLKILLSLGLMNPYDLRLYSTAQASLVFCLLLSATLSQFGTQKLRVFLILAVNCALHLILDALQIKWGNGVHLISPLSWQMFHLGLSWPEHPATILITVTGFLFFLYNWNKLLPHRTSVELARGVRSSWTILFLLLYLLGPLYFLPELEKDDVYYIHTLRQSEARPGKSIAFDRAHYSAEFKQLRSWSGEQFSVIGPQPSESGRVSFKGHFLTPAVFISSQYHLHKDFRDLSSLTGLIMTCLLLTQSFILSCIATLRANLRKRS